MLDGAVWLRRIEGSRTPADDATKTAIRLRLQGAHGTAMSESAALRGSRCADILAPMASSGVDPYPYAVALSVMSDAELACVYRHMCIGLHLIGERDPPRADVLKAAWKDPLGLLAAETANDQHKALCLAACLQRMVN